MTDTLSPETVEELRKLSKAATPGPFTVSGCRVKAFIGNVKTDAHAIWAGNEPVALVYYSDRDGLHSETFANAKLIAKALDALPALLDALDAERRNSQVAVRMLSEHENGRLQKEKADLCRELASMKDARDTERRRVEALEQARDAVRFVTSTTGGGRYDLAVSFATLEALRDAENFFAGIARTALEDQTHGQTNG